jgi:hypothetical protein
MSRSGMEGLLASDGQGSDQHMCQPTYWTGDLPHKPMRNLKGFYNLDETFHDHRCHVGPVSSCLVNAPLVPS